MEVKTQVPQCFNSWDFNKNILESLLLKKKKKKDFLSEQCKAIEENDRMGKTRDLFKKIRDSKDISCNNGHNKGQKWYGSNRSRRY